MENTLRTAAELLRSGKLVAFPTETVYGLGANALDAAAVARLFAAKGRPGKNPVIVHVAEPDRVGEVAAHWPENARRLAEKFWPGPLTLVVPKSDRIPSEVTAGGPTVGLRCPAHPVARELIRLAGIPVAAPSANRSGELSPTLAVHVERSLGNAVDLILDGGPCPGGLESTVVDVSGDSVRLLRPGLVTREQLEAVVGEVLSGSGAGEVLRSPGMLTKHYSPRTPLETGETAEEAEYLAKLYETAGLRVGRYELPADAERAANRLYADLHELDARGFDRIIVTLPPAAEPWLAIRDRLIRAAAEE